MTDRMSPRAGDDRTAAIMSAIESNPEATDTEIAERVGDVSRQRVGQVRAELHGADPTRRGGPPRVAAGEGTADIKVRVPASLKEWAEQRAGGVSATVRTALEQLRAREERRPVCPHCKSRDVTSEPGAQGETVSRCGSCGRAWVAP